MSSSKASTNIFRKVRIQEPSDDVAQAYLDKARKSLLSAKMLFEIEHYEDATALAYYVMYYCATAVLAKIGIKSENHTVTILLFEKLGVEITSLKKAKEERIEKQYYITNEELKEPTQTTIRDAEQFLNIINAQIEMMQRNEIEKMREQVLRIVS